jgi:hypothetical protein
MQENQLIINGKNIDLSDDTKIGVTYQANNLGELKNRQGTFTNVFKVPRTRNNELNLEHVSIITSATLIPYRKSEATYTEGGIELISKGEAFIQGVDEKFIYINVLSGNVDLSKAIGDVIVGDLYVNDTPHNWNQVNVVNSRWGNEYYIYPFIDWRIDLGNFFAAPIVNPSQMLPTCIVSGLFERLEIYTGYSFKGSYIESDDHKNMILTPDSFSLNEAFIDEDSLEASFSPQSFELLVPEGSGYISGENDIQFSINDPGFLLGIYYPPINQVGRLRFTGNFAIRQIYDNGGLGFGELPKDGEYWFITQIKNNSGTVLAEKTFEHQAGSIADLDSFKNFVIDIQAPEMILLSGEGYYCNIIAWCEKHSNADTKLEFGFDSNKAFFIKSPGASLVYENEIRFRDLFRMKAKDVIKDVLELRGIVIQTDSYTKEVRFNYFQDLINNKPIAKDWSEKVHLPAHELSFNFGAYGQRNWLRFKENTDVEDELGDYYFDVDDQTLEDEIDSVNLKHSATQEDNRYLGYNIPEIEAIDSLNKWQKPGWRLLQIDRQITTFDVEWNDGTFSNIGNQSIPFARFVGFEELVPLHYDILKDILDRTKGIVLPIKLNATDIQSLDFVIPIFLDVPELDINGYFYINKISNYKEGITPVQFIRL